MNIAVDCRYLGKSGIGRVCQGLIDNLDYSTHKYYLIGNKQKLEKYKNAVVIEDNTEPYSKSGLLSFDKSLNKLCDALIIPNFLIPFGVKIPVHSIIHDLIFLDLDVSNRGFIDKAIKKFLLKRCVKKSKTIACVSAFTKGRVKHHFKKYANKCYVNYIGLSNSVLNYTKPENFVKKDNTFIYVGNVKPHKGLKTLIEAYHCLPEGEYNLKIIGKKDNFLNGISAEELSYNDVTFTGELSDEQLLTEIAQATYLVQPSQYEGFGLPPLEALYLGTKPIISDIEVFKEVYSDLPVEFFNGVDELKGRLTDKNYNVKDVKKQISQKYSYKNFAKKFIEKTTG